MPFVQAQSKLEHSIKKHCFGLLVYRLICRLNGQNWWEPNELWGECHYFTFCFGVLCPEVHLSFRYLWRARKKRSSHLMLRMRYFWKGKDLKKKYWIKLGHKKRVFNAYDFIWLHKRSETQESENTPVRWQEYFLEPYFLFFFRRIRNVSYSSYWFIAHILNHEIQKHSDWS